MNEDTAPRTSDTPGDPWQGEQGEWWLAKMDRTEAVLAPFTDDLMSAASIQPGEAVLDVGCGGGTTTLVAARAARPGRVVGVDVAGRLVERARERAAAAGVDNVAFERGDAQIHPFPAGGYDVMISRFGVMFFADPLAAFQNLARSLRSDGRLAFVSWQAMERNDYLGLLMRVAAEHGVVPEIPAGDGPDPWTFSDPAKVRGLLEGAGLRNVSLLPVERRLRVGADPDDVLEHWTSQPRTKALLAAADGDVTARITGAVREKLEARQARDGVFLSSAAWVVTADR